jgi:alkylhydroperoxidase/carboxymuconolactone decarboxylase family protein YurZ
MGDITKILDPLDLNRFRNDFDRNEMNAILRGFFVEAYSLDGDPFKPKNRYVSRYLESLDEAFFKDAELSDELSEDAERDRLTPADRERCLVAILASRGPDVNLAIHVYIALMEGVEPAELGHIAFLAGIYTGVDSLTETIKIIVIVLETLDELLPEGKTGALAVVQALTAKLPVGKGQSG